MALDDLRYVTRVHYRADNVPSDGVWGEHEIDYILLAQCRVSLVPNPDEVKGTLYATREQLREMIGEFVRRLLTSEYF